MKRPFLLLVYLAFLANLFSCQRTPPANTNETPIIEKVKIAYREGGTVSGEGDTIPPKKDGTPVKIPKGYLKPLELPADSIYPREYSYRGMESYIKMWKGVYAYLKSYSGVSYDLEISRIDFFDTLGRKISDFDVVENNPYSKQAFPNLEDENYQEYVYRSFIPKTITQGKAQYKPRYFYTYTQMPSSQSMPVVGYHLLGAIEGGVTDWKFTAICFDERGNILRKFENLDIDPYEFCVSENKKFFAVAYGGLRGEELTRLRNNGFRIYEMETGNLVYEMEVDGKHTISGPVADNSYENIPFGSLGSRGNDFADPNNKDYLVIKIDFNNRIIYRRKFLPEEKSKIVGVDTEGFFMRDPITKKKWKLLLKENEGFEIEKF